MTFKLWFAASVCALTIAASAQAQSQQSGTVSPNAYGSGTSSVSNDCAQQPPDIGPSSGCNTRHNNRKPEKHPITQNPSGTPSNASDSNTMTNSPPADGTANNPGAPH
jgi:hypothetical protein